MNDPELFINAPALASTAQAMHDGVVGLTVSGATISNRAVGAANAERAAGSPVGDSLTEFAQHWGFELSTIGEDLEAVAVTLAGIARFYADLDAGIAGRIG